MVTSVSVIIPCYNHAHYLPLAVRSVLTQTCPDWEAIVVDDGSTDATRAIMAQFSDPRVHYIYQTNQGLSAARNTGIQASQGEYLAFLDADDEWDPEFLTTCRQILQVDRSIVGVFTRCRFIDTESKALPVLGGQHVPSPCIRDRLLEGGFFPPNAILIRAAVLADVGLFDTALTSVEDWDLWLRISSRYQLLSLPEPLARYRISPGSMSTNADRMHANRMAVLTKYFGEAEGDPQTWAEEKRRVYAFAYRSAALGHLQGQKLDDAWYWFGEASRTWPSILARLDTFYEMALGDQPAGYRGQANMLNIAVNATAMLSRLDALFFTASKPVQALKRIAYGNAYLALTMLSDQAGQWSQARRNLLRALRVHPGLLCQLDIVHRLFKLCAGKRVVNRLRAWKVHTATESYTESDL